MDDLSELDQLIADIEHMPVVAALEGERLVTRAAQDLTTEARSFAPSGPYTPQYPASITYDVEIGDRTISAEVGPDKDKRQGALGNILEYGTAVHAPQAHLGPALDRESPRFHRSVDLLGERLLR